MDRISPEPKLSTFPDASANDTNHSNSSNNNNNNNVVGGKKRKGNLTSLSPSPLFGRPSSPRQSEERIGHNYHIYKAKAVSDGKKSTNNHSPTTEDNSTNNNNSNKRFAGAATTGVTAGNNIPNATGGGGGNEGSGRLSKEPPNPRLRQKHADIHQHTFHFHQHPPTLQPQQNIIFQNSSNGASTSNSTSPATNFTPLEHQSSSGGVVGSNTTNAGGNTNITTTTTARFKGKLPALPDQSDPLRRVLSKPSAASTITTKFSNASSTSEDTSNSNSHSHNLIGKAINNNNNNNNNNGNITGNNNNASGQGSSNVTSSGCVGSGSSSPSPPLKQWEFRVPQRKQVVESRLDVSTDACDEEQGSLKVAGNSNSVSRHAPPPPPQGPPPNLKFQRHSLSLPYQSAPPPHMALKQPTGVLKSGKMRAGGGGGASVSATLQRGNNNNNTNNNNNNTTNGYSTMVSAASGGGGVNDIFIAGHQRVGMMLADDPNAATAHTLLVLEGAVARERRLRDELAQARRQVTAGFRSVVKNYLAAYPLPNTTSSSGTTSSLPPVFGPPRGANAVTTTNRGGAPSLALSVPMLKCSVVTNTLVTTIQSYLRFKSSAMVTAGRVRALVDSAPPLLGTAAAPPARDLHTAAAQHDDTIAPNTAVDFDPEGSGRLDSATLAKLKQLYFAYYDCETYVIHPDEEGSSPNAKPLLASNANGPTVSGKDGAWINNPRSDVRNVIEEANVLVEQQYGNMGYDAMASGGGGGGGKESSWGAAAAPPAAVLDIAEGQSLLFDEEREWKQIYSDEEDEEDEEEDR